MKQIFQNLKDGEVFFLDVPYPNLEKNKIIIKTSKSLISSGTEKYLIKFGKSNYFQKAINEPKRLEQVISKIKNDGFFSTYEAVKSKLDLPFPMGYCNVGVVDKSSNIEFKKGDRVVSNTNHSELVISNPNFTCHVPDNVSDDDACYAIPISICLHGIRLLNLTFGETIAVYGLGLLGLLSVQILKNSGYKVCGIDTDIDRLDIASSMGIECFNSNDEFLEKQILNFNNGKKIDGSLITASSNNKDLLNNISKPLRQKGKILCVGSVPINFDRNLIYKKEISFQVSASYGPERYNHNYENSKNDYPPGIARWSIKRNLQYALELISEKKINLHKLKTKTFKFKDAKEAYQNLLNSNSISLILEYDNVIDSSDEIVVGKINRNNRFSDNDFNIGVIGAGNYSTRYIIPQIKKNKLFNLESLSSSKGVSAAFFSKKFEFEKATTNNSSIIKEKKIGTIFIASPHNLHADQVIECLKMQKKVFVEKPLSINNHQLTKIKNTCDDLIKSGNYPFFTVGYNRRFSPLTKILLDNIKEINEPCSINYNINSGYLDSNSWIQNKEIGGGRIIGEICHFIDLIKYITGSVVTNYDFKYIDTKDKIPDTLSIQFALKNNSIANINYFSNGNISFPKEIIDVYCGGIIMQLNNFKSLKVFGKSKFKNKNLLIQNKGNKNCIDEFLSRIANNEDMPISIEDLLDTSKITQDITESIIK